MKALATLILITCCVAGQALAEFSSMRPMPRPSLTAPDPVPTDVQISGVVVGTSGRVIRPMPRPETIIVAAPAPIPKRGLLGALFGSKKVVAKKPNAQAPRTYGSSSICNDPAIQGTAIPTIRGAQKGCGVETPVRITAVDGVTLSMPVTVDCDTARALRKWVTKKVKPAFGRNGVTKLHVAAHYACRPRNNKRGARVSEHGRGKAIDIAGFTLANGTELSVAQDYKSSQGKAIRRAHKGACGVFGTTLGPGSDGYHEDHLHFDTAKYRGGPYCK